MARRFEIGQQTPFSLLVTTQKFACNSGGFGSIRSCWIVARAAGSPGSKHAKDVLSWVREGAMLMRVRSVAVLSAAISIVLATAAFAAAKKRDPKEPSNTPMTACMTEVGTRLGADGGLRVALAIPRSKRTTTVLTELPLAA